MRGRRFSAASVAFTALTLLVVITGTGDAERHGFTRFVPRALPQRALGDFDGDGRSDLALIQDGSDGRSISVTLSGSTQATRFEANVTGLVESDIDKDGDLDLVAATPTGGLIVWINDGHGHFTRQDASPALPVVADTSIARAMRDAWVAVVDAPVGCAPNTGAVVAISVASVRRYRRSGVPASAVGLLPPLRAPPGPARPGIA
jgi:hypothetical protein